MNQNEQKTHRHTMLGSLMNLKKLGFYPNVIIDVGAQVGTIPLYETFPEATHFLIEPIQEYEDDLAKICAQLKKADYLIAAITKKTGVVNLCVKPDLKSSQIVDANIDQQTANWITRTVPAITLDEACQKRQLKGPYLIKIDVDGKEVDVLAGAIHILKQTEYVIVETTLFNQQIYNIIDFMREYNFVIYDMVDPLYRLVDHALWQVDMAFVKKQGQFRQIRSFATSTQQELLQQKAQEHRETIREKNMNLLPEHEKKSGTQDDIVCSKQIFSTPPSQNEEIPPFEKGGLGGISFPDDVIFLVSYPKSGSTWLRFLIGNYLTNGHCDFTNYHQIVPDIHFNPEQLEQIQERPRFIKSHWPFTPDYQKVVYIVRDGRDVALSYYFHFLRKGKNRETWFFKDFLSLFNTTGTLDKFTFWSHHVNEWLDNAPKNFLLVRYEDMQTNTSTELNRVLDFASIPVNQQTLKIAVEAAHFKRMQQLEKQQRSFYPTLADSVPNQYAVRNGKIGESKHYFNEELMSQFLEVHSSALKRLGYLRRETRKKTHSGKAQVFVKSSTQYSSQRNTLKQGPDFIFIGCQKCGSTSMYKYLIEHPHILEATRKQIHFFDRFFDRGIDWYLEHFPANQNKSGYITGEATPSYLFHPLVPKQVYQFFPAVKLIIVLRNPIDRLVSHYNMALRNGVESLSLDEALACEIERTQVGWKKIIAEKIDEDYQTYSRYCYLSRGIYIEQLKRWMNFFPKEQFLISSSEDFFREPATTLNQVFEFLGLSHYQLDEYIPYGKAVYPTISPATRHTLAEFYRPYNQQLEEYLGMSFHWDSIERDSVEINAKLQNILVSYQQKRAMMLTQLSDEKSLPISCESEESGDCSSPKKSEENLDLNNIVLTGIPRSGTTLACYLLNKLPNTVALNEPIAYRHLQSLQTYQEICAYICRFFEQIRDSIYHHKMAESKTVNGQIEDNMAGEQFNQTGIRQWLASPEDNTLLIEKALTNNFLLVIKKPVIFTIVLEQLIQHFPAYAIIRNPLSVLASWSSVPLGIKNGHSPAEKWDANLAHHLTQQPDRIARQLHLLSWYYEKYQRYLPTHAILRYEEIIASSGQALSMITPKASQLNEPLESKNINPLYDRELMLVLGERLLKSEGAFWAFYAKEEVEQLLEKCSTLNRANTRVRPSENHYLKHNLPISNSKPIPSLSDATALQKRGKFNQAIAVYREIVNQNPDNAEAHFELGHLLRWQGQLEPAIQHYQRTVELKPDWEKAKTQLTDLQPWQQEIEKINPKIRFVPPISVLFMRICCPKKQFLI